LTWCSWSRRMGRGRETILTGVTFSPVTIIHKVQGSDIMKQYEAVIQVMQENGGFATLGHLYQAVLKVPDCKWGTKTPFASIRGIVQTNSNFFKIRPGLWGLSKEKENILHQLSLTHESNQKEGETSDHSYYQGLIAEIGNLKGYKTYVPNQDRQKQFLRHRLSDVSTLSEFYSFTYDHLVRRARTVDVTWFNERMLPDAFFEVEHSTDIQNSLLKFIEFQDFRTDFFIVAPATRRREFDAKVAYSVFGPVRAYVKFLDYDMLSELHSKISAATAAERLSGF
jgi:hypothetical protein